jgi:peptide/nickel transport system permease protein
LKKAIFKRVLLAIPTLLGVSVLVFLLLSASGDPARLIAGPDATRESLEAIRKDLHLDKPIPVQYLLWLGSAVRGDLGKSWTHSRPVMREIALSLPATLELAATTMFFATLISMIVALLSVRKPGGLFDGVARGTLFVFLAMPAFWLGLELIILFSRKASLFPPAGRGEGTLRSHVAHLLLPALTLGIGTSAALCRVLRASLLEVLHADYVRTARAKGLSGRIVLMKHTLRNALIPFVTLSGLTIAVLLEGSIIVESVFSWPGLGTVMIEAIKSRDAPIAMAGVLTIAVIYVTVTVIIDVLYVVIDPRVRLEGGSA